MVGAAIIGGVVSAGATAYSGKKNADAVKSGSREANQLSQAQFERGLQEVEPFKNAGLTALPGLTSAANEDFQQFGFRDQSNYLDDYFSNPNGEYAALEKQARDQILRGASVTGGLRSGGSNVNLAMIAPTLGLNALDRINQRDLQAYSVNQGARADRFNRLNALAGLGANVASGNQVAGANFASNAGANAMAAAQARGQGYLQNGQALSGLATDATSLYLGNKLGYFDRQNGAKI